MNACRTLIIIPAYNESKIIQNVIQNIFMNCSGADILIIDDGSKDDTSTIAEQCGCKVIRLINNLGIGGGGSSRVSVCCQGAL